MKELFITYKKKLFLWYFILILGSISLIFNLYQVLKLFNNFKKLQTLKEAKVALLTQIGELNYWISQINPKEIGEPLSLQMTLNFEINSLSEAISNLNLLYGERGSLFKVEKLTISPCEALENQTIKTTCLYQLKLSGTKIKYLFGR
ncbi:MAG: hypothetical protein NZ530_03905 [Thermodesulfobacteriaceae bacterium]|nr:hypothetical protein [Thermodesulfobacteriaceae bacterium]MCX8041015.1 hypothetical protein [Thermodesulfobacteriaceae bacterium]MDW8135254.1 hypothetical protein [Thermodesulfobacterium sp.]